MIIKYFAWLKNITKIEEEEIDNENIVEDLYVEDDNQINIKTNQLNKIDQMNSMNNIIYQKK